MGTLDLATSVVLKRGVRKGSGGIAVRLARRWPDVSADGLLPSMRHSSAQSGTTTATLESCIRSFGSTQVQQHQIVAQQSGQDTCAIF